MTEVQIQEETESVAAFEEEVARAGNQAAGEVCCLDSEACLQSGQKHQDNGQEKDFRRDRSAGT